MMDTVMKVAIYAIPLIFAITIHEAAHGWMARRYGDNTAWMMGRVTLNPIPHVDLVGTILVPGALILGSAISGMGGAVIGWAKPVPIATRNLRPFRQAMLMVSAAGPLSNLFQALVWLVALKLVLMLGLYYQFLIEVTIAGVIVNFCLMAFNLFPLPPLDGGRIMTMILPYNLARHFARLEDYGMIVLVVLLLSGLLSMWLRPFMSVARTLLHWVLY